MANSTNPPTSRTAGRLSGTLARTWPFGLGRSTALWFIIGFIALIGLFYPLDRPLSAWGQGLPDWLRIGLATQGDGVPYWQGAFSVPVESLFRWVTRWGESDWILIPSLCGIGLAWLLSLATRDRLRDWARQWLLVSSFIFLGVGVPSLVATLLKRIIGRARPVEWTSEAPLSFRSLNWDAYTYQSFPSGHSTTAFSLALTIAFLWPKSLWPMLGVAVLIAVSRIITGQHYLTDITAGAVLGTLGAFAVRNFFRRRGWLFDRTDTGDIVRRPFGPTR